ncbi:ketopantoate reductase family protein [Sphingobium sp. LSP13-1-1.1]|uniref:ketopantoate reductase family protein n=1 Tax=Sphingobium sp. LSP13-1-1.1 TaxID=3135234 RepID=UPI0034211965
MRSVMWGCLLQSCSDAPTATGLWSIRLSGAAFANTTLPVEAAPDIRRSLWEKFLLAACLGTVAAALDLPAGSVLSHMDGESLQQRALAEVAADVRSTRPWAVQSCGLLRSMAFRTRLS